MPTFEDFKKKHVLNPRRHEGFEHWDSRDQNLWLRNRLAQINGSPNQAYGRKNLNSVIIATSEEILEDFRTPGVKFQPQEDFYWSNRAYPIWLFRKRGGGQGNDDQYSVTKLHETNGPMHFLARVDQQSRPIHYHAQSPSPSPNSFPR